eukprot:gene994-1121_t
MGRRHTEISTPGHGHRTGHKERHVESENLQRLDPNSTSVPTPASIGSVFTGKSNGLDDRNNCDMEECDSEGEEEGGVEGAGAALGDREGQEEDDDEDDDAEQLKSLREHAAVLESIGAALGDREVQEEEDDEDDDAEQLKSLREHAAVLESIGDIPAAESMYQRTLRLDPTDLTTLHRFAFFLHRRKGELGRAEAFYRRALQLSIPGLLPALNMGGNGRLVVDDDEGDDDVRSPVSHADAKPPVDTSPMPDVINDPSIRSSNEEGGRAPRALPSGPHVERTARIKVKAIIRLLLDYGAFLRRARGDVDAALALYRRAAEIAPDNCLVLASLAHFLAEGCTSGTNCKKTEHHHHPADVAENERCVKEAEELFIRALKADPSDTRALSWYAKLLRRTGRLAQAEVLYRVAVTKSAETNSAASTKVQVTASTKTPEGVTGRRRGSKDEEESYSFEPTAICNY